MSGRITASRTSSSCRPARCDPAPARQPVLHRLVGTHRRAAEIAAMDDADYLDALRPRFGDFLGEIACRRALQLPALAQHRRRLRRPAPRAGGRCRAWRAPDRRTGLNLGLRDVAALAEVLTDAHRRGEDIAAPDVLARYQHGGASTPPRWPSPPTPSTGCFRTTTRLRAARDIGMGLVNAAPALRRRFIREAAGLTGDLPRLLQGRRSDAGAHRIPFIFPSVELPRLAFQHDRECRCGSGRPDARPSRSAPAARHRS
jgi:hypothetical protein